MRLVRKSITYDNDAFGFSNRGYLLGNLLEESDSILSYHCSPAGCAPGPTNYITRFALNRKGNALIVSDAAIRKRVFGLSHAAHLFLPTQADSWQNQGLNYSIIAIPSGYMTLEDYCLNYGPLTSNMYLLVLGHTFLFLHHLHSGCGMTYNNTSPRSIMIHPGYPERPRLIDFTSSRNSSRVNVIDDRVAIIRLLYNHTAISGKFWDTSRERIAAETSKSCLQIAEEAFSVLRSGGHSLPMGFSV